MHRNIDSSPRPAMRHVLMTSSIRQNENIISCGSVWQMAFVTSRMSSYLIHFFSLLVKVNLCIIHIYLYWQWSGSVVDRRIICLPQGHTKSHCSFPKPLERRCLFYDHQTENQHKKLYRSGAGEEWMMECPWYFEQDTLWFLTIHCEQQFFFNVQYCREKWSCFQWQAYMTQWYTIRLCKR